MKRKMKEKETYEKLPYSSPAIDAISLQDRLAVICNSVVGGNPDVGHIGDGEW